MALTLLMQMRVMHQEICGGRFGKYSHPSDLKKFTQKTQQRILDAVEEFGIDGVGGMMERWRNWMMDDQFAQSNNFKMELFFSRHGDYTDAAFYEPDPPNHAEHLAEAERLGIEIKKRREEGIAKLREKGYELPNR